MSDDEAEGCATCGCLMFTIPLKLAFVAFVILGLIWLIRHW